MWFPPVPTVLFGFRTSLESPFKTVAVPFPTLRGSLNQFTCFYYSLSTVSSLKLLLL